MQGNKNAPFEKKETQCELDSKNIHDTCAFRSLCSSRLSVVSTFVFQFYLDTHICKGQLFSKCPFGVLKSTKKPTKCL